MNSYNEKTIKSILDLIKGSVQNFHFKGNQNDPITFKRNDIGMSDPRYPNMKEQKEWLKDRLRYEYHCGKIGISKSQYYTLKGHLNNYQFNGVINFFEKRGCSTFRDLFYKYKNFKGIVDVTQLITFQTDQMVACVDIQLNKERKPSLKLDAASKLDYSE